MNTCKECGKPNNNGTKFCSHKCRVKWMKDHNYTKKDWKHINRQNGRILIRMSGGTDQGMMGDHRKEEQ